jgi:hypothetical protein
MSIWQLCVSKTVKRKTRFVAFKIFVHTCQRMVSIEFEMQHLQYNMHLTPMSFSHNLCFPASAPMEKNKTGV